MALFDVGVDAELTLRASNDRLFRSQC